MEENTADGRIYATFEQHQQYQDIQRSLLSCNVLQEPTKEDNSTEVLLLKRLSDILNEYQEQPYLLDPFLECLVSPVVESLKTHARTLVKAPEEKLPGLRVGRIALLLYEYTKFRGYKIITRFFPHEIADVSIALDYVLLPNSPANDPSQWHLRYVVLLWLSLICMIPFDLEQFDERDKIGETAQKIERLGRSYLCKAGLEREGAAILLSRLYMRQDMTAKLSEFLQWSLSVIQEPADPFTSLGLLQVLCEVAKSGSVEQVKAHLSSLLNVVQLVQDHNTLMNDTVVRKMRVKLASRIILRLLPAGVATRSKGHVLPSAWASESESLREKEDEDFDVPEEVDTILEDLFRAVQDKDTVVRWSAAKGIARVSERLPVEFAEQVLQTIVGLFSIHSIATASLYDMPTVAESTWHGACLACAEMARRGLVPDDKLPELIGWLSKALYFDIRKGAHSIGSNVRDAASYVLWSLARAQRVAALVPHAETLSHRLVVVSLFDREIHIRRAASATFQEYVGRTGLFPHGIDVLRKTDFYAVGVRRNAFLTAAPEVAEHTEYRPSMITHLLTVTLRHWDPTMRELGAQSLRCICQLDLASLGPSSVQKASHILPGPDASDIHGALLALKDIASAYSESNERHDWEAERRQVFAHLSEVPLRIVQSARHELVTATACQLIASSISAVEIQLDQSTVPHWRQIVDYGLKSKSSVVQEAAATSMAACSHSWSAFTFILDFHSASMSMHQSVSRMLGVLDYNMNFTSIPSAIQCLLDCVDRSVPANMLDIETRRNAYTSMSQIISNVAENITKYLPPTIFHQIMKAFQDGLTDYSVDERGDVGSWARIACVRGLTSTTEVLFTRVPPNFAEYLPATTYHNYIGGILKQGAERLDNVRQVAGECFVRLLLLPLPTISNADEWRIQGDIMMKELFLSDSEVIGWNDSLWLFPKVVMLLDIELYRDAILAGLILSASSKTASTQRPVSSGLVTYANALPVAMTARDTYDLCGFARDLVAQAQRNVTSNTRLIPVLQTVNILLEANVFDRLGSDSAGLDSLQQLLLITTKNISRLKNPLRIMISMRIVINLWTISQLRAACRSHFASFLTHQYPKVRSDTAEYLYLILQSRDLGFETDDAETILLETEWMSSDSLSIQGAAQRSVELLSADTDHSISYCAYTY
ncbi:TBCD protein [Sparassis crispa]|uniref:TBCD protein n=1 Tax=Sparassis crispa TaxID=139825 RepID=A0A401GRU4_9APHY|nr:TBCD protein [Sparassis crispa]GBE84936.1 TBCD protein [Sparassis crispa]